jgi:ribose transport system substrate-binding protein
MCVFTFNQNGANIAAQKCAAAGIPLIADGNSGEVLKSGYNIVAAVDFDWTAMGKNYAQYIAKNYPGENIAIIMGLSEMRPNQDWHTAFESEVTKLGKNKIVAIREGKYDPAIAANAAQDLVQSGIKFSILYVFNEEMAASVVRVLKVAGVLNKPIKVIAQNGAPYGLDLIKEGSIKYSISSSPGWGGMIDCLALQAYTTGKIKKLNQQLLLPITPVSNSTINDKTKVVPWDVDPVWLDLTKKYFPQFNGLY